jgi:hypothetical protein
MDAGTSPPGLPAHLKKRCSAAIVARGVCCCTPTLSPNPLPALTPSSTAHNIAPARPQKERPLGSEPWFNPEGVTAAKVRRAAAVATA